MSDPNNEFKNQAQVDTRANLFYFLQNLPGTVDDKGHLRTSPDRHRLESFFGAVFQNA